MRRGHQHLAINKPAPRPNRHSDVFMVIRERGEARSIVTYGASDTVPAGEDKPRGHGVGC
jgi:hypothetical protein